MTSQTFVNVLDDEKSLLLVEKAFKEDIQPLYGDQSKAIEKIKSGKDRTCEVLLVDGIPRGFIIYKNQLQNEFGLVNAFEVKTIFVFKETIKTNKNILKHLFARFREVANSYNATCIYGTIVAANQKLSNHFHRIYGVQTFNYTKSGDNNINVTIIFIPLRSNNEIQK